VTALPRYRLDTHAVYWHRTASPKLSPAPDQVFAEAVQGKAILILSHVFVAEPFYLLQKHGHLVA
jgi:hypothetical protein